MNAFEAIKENVITRQAAEMYGIRVSRYALPRFLGVEDSEYTYQCLRLFMLGAISRVFNPGCEFEVMLCLVGG